jgi:threonyl-tRNA synthetase
VAVRTRGAGNKQEVIAVDEFIRRLQEAIERRTLTP